MKKNPSNVRPSDNPTAHPSCTPGEKHRHTRWKLKPWTQSLRLSGRSRAAASTFHQTNQTWGGKLQEEKRKTPFSVSIKTLLLFQSEAPATSRVDSSLSTFPLICEDLSWFSITALSFSSSHFLFTRSLTKLVSLSAVRLLPRTETESVYSPDSVSARHWSPFLFCYSLIHTLTRLHTHGWNEVGLFFIFCLVAEQSL